jgi:repressor LexA
MRSKDRNLMEKIRTFVDEFTIESFGKPPTNRDIGEEFNMSHVSAHRYLQAMHELGMLVYEDGEVHTDIIDKFNTDMRTVAELDATVPAGSPDMLEDVCVKEYLPVPAALVRGQRGRFYMMEITGDSMVSVGIDEGDFVIFREANSAKLGDIVIAYVESYGNTIKRLSLNEDGERFLLAENEEWTDEERNFGTEFQIRGVAIKVMKDL